MSKFKQVSKDDFYKFAEKRFEQTGVKLVKDVSQMVDPPLLTLNDFSTGEKWPKSIVAKADMYDGSERDDFKQPEYFIKEDELIFLKS